MKNYVKNLIYVFVGMFVVSLLTEIGFITSSGSLELAFIFAIVYLGGCIFEKSEKENESV